MRDKYSIKDLKVAVINEDLKALEKISKMEYEVNSIEEAKEMLQYMELAKELIEKEKNKLSKEMAEIRKLKKYTTSF